MAEHFQCQLIGTGTAGLSFIIALMNKINQAPARHKSKLQALLNSLIAIEGYSKIGGVLASYQINANTNAGEMVDCLCDGTPFSALRDRYLQQPETQQALIPLPKVGELMLQPVADIITALLGDSRLRCNAQVDHIVASQRGFESFDEADQLLAQSQKVVLCCGGREVRLADLYPWRHKTIMTTPLLTQTTTAGLPDQPGDIVIVGSSHSAFSTVWRLLNDPQISAYAQGRGIIILQRSALIKLRCTPEFADQHQLAFDPINDVCPVNGLVYRHAGLRKDAKMLYLKIKYGEEKRVRIQTIKALADAKKLFDEAAVIVQCTGFKANLPRLIINGVPRTIKQQSKRGELSDTNNNAIVGLFGFGLGIQMTPEGDYRGEKSFEGSSDGLLTYSNAIAPIIIDQLVQN